MGNEAPTTVDVANAAHTLVDQAIDAPQKREVSIVVARAVLHYFGDDNLGIEAGSFTTRLIRTIVVADKENRERLRTVYPEHVAAVHAVQHAHWGLDWLRKIAREVA